MSTPLGAGITPRRAVDGRLRVLVAGACAADTAPARATLSESMPDATLMEIHDTWTLLRHARRAGLVVMVGDLADAPAGATVRLLGHRHPDLPVRST